MATEKSISENFVALTLFAALGAGGLWMGGVAVKDFALARDSLSWPAVDGVVLSKSSEDSNDIRYAYVAGGHGHESRRVRFLTGLVYKAPTAQLRPGESVSVYVNPDAPDNAVLKQGGHGLVFGVAAAIAAGLVFFGLGGVIRTLTVMVRRSAPPAASAAAAAAPAPQPNSAE